MPNTVRLHRVLATRPEKVYRAFLEADALAKWLPPNGFTCTVHHLEPKVGGTFRMSFRNFTTGNGHAFGGEYREQIQLQRKAKQPAGLLSLARQQKQAAGEERERGLEQQQRAVASGISRSSLRSAFNQSSLTHCYQQAQRRAPYAPLPRNDSKS